MHEELLAVAESRAVAAVLLDACCPGIQMATATTLFRYPRGRVGTYTIPSGVTRLGGETFSGCDVLTGITPPSTLTRIGQGAFGYCRGLTGITIPAAVTFIEENSFYGSSGLITAIFLGNAQSFHDSNSQFTATAPGFTQ